MSTYEHTRDHASIVVFTVSPDTSGSKFTQRSSRRQHACLPTMNTFRQNVKQRMAGGMQRDALDFAVDDHVSGILGSAYKTASLTNQGHQMEMSTCRILAMFHCKTGKYPATSTQASRFKKGDGT